MRILKLFENCHITKGASRCLIADMQRRNLFLIPNSLADLFDEFHTIRVDNDYQTEDAKLIFDEYAAFLLSNELAFLCNEDMIARFPIINHYRPIKPIVNTKRCLTT